MAHGTGGILEIRHGRGRAQNGEPSPQETVHFWGGSARGQHYLQCRLRPFLSNCSLGVVKMARYFCALPTSATARGLSLPVSASSSPNAE
jgi:hypothetical protein